MVYSESISVANVVVVALGYAEQVGRTQGLGEHLLHQDHGM
jgi:hypothetical protein